VWSGGGGIPRPWVPGNNATAVSYINSIEVFWNGTALNTFCNGCVSNARTGFRLWGSTLMPPEANGASIISVDQTSAARRAGGGAGSNYRVSMRDGGTTAINFSTRHFIPYNAGAFGHHIFTANFPNDPNGDVWTPEYINATGVSGFQFGLFQDTAKATGCSVSYIDMEVLWSGDSQGILAVGISLLLPLLLPVLGGMNLQNLKDAEFAQVHHTIKRAAYESKLLTYPSIVLPEEREKVFKELSRPTYGV